MFTSEHPDVVSFRESFPVLAESPAVARGHRMLYEHPAIDAQIERWWRAEVVTRWPGEWRAFGTALYSYERWSRPIYQGPRMPVPPGWHWDGAEYASKPVTFDYPMEEVLANLDAGPPSRTPTTYRFRAPRGFHDHLDNHETGAHFFAEATVVPSHELTGR